jgi:hypothetical protein
MSLTEQKTSENKMGSDVNMLMVEIFRVGLTGVRLAMQIIPVSQPPRETINLSYIRHRVVPTM